MTAGADAGRLTHDTEPVPAENIITPEVLGQHPLPCGPDPCLQARQIRIFLALVENTGFGEYELLLLQRQK